MKIVGFPISVKENEKRRAVVIDDLIKNKDICKFLHFESGYGEDLGFSDLVLLNLGCCVEEKDKILKSDIIVDPKIGDAPYLSKLSKDQTIFGWIHATQNKEIADVLISTGVRAIAWENMFYKGRHVFWRNNELAGEAAVMDAFLCYGKLPFGTRCAIIGNGNTARGAFRVLSMLGASVTQYTRKTEDLLREEISRYDVIVNCVLWDISRKDHIIYKEDLKRMKKGSLIIDVSCDRNGGIETSVPTTIEEPTYYVDGVMHYSVDHTPSLFYKTFSKENSEILMPFIRDLIYDKTNNVLEEATVINKGKILDESINLFQNRK